MNGFLAALFRRVRRHSSVARILKRRRFRAIEDVLGSMNGKRVVDIGCAWGVDFLQFVSGDIWGVDLRERDMVVDNVTFRKADARALPFEDDFFDVAVSIGVFEHIQPIESLAVAASEIARISKSYCVIVPAVSTILEPHTLRFRWQMRDHNKKIGYSRLNYFSDEAWLMFKGFADAKTRRFGYVPGLVTNLLIYKPLEQ